MYLVIIVLVILASLLMCGIVLIQESKGGGLASGFSSSNQIMGVRKTTDFLEKATWSLAIAIVILAPSGLCPRLLIAAADFAAGLLTSILEIISTM